MQGECGEVCFLCEAYQLFNGFQERRRHELGE